MKKTCKIHYIKCYIRGCINQLSGSNRINSKERNRRILLEVLGLLRTANSISQIELTANNKTNK